LSDINVLLAIYDCYGTAVFSPSHHTNEGTGDCGAQQDQQGREDQEQQHPHPACSSAQHEYRLGWGLGKGIREGEQGACVQSLRIFIPY